MNSEIAYTKSWCGFKHARGASSAYITWYKEIKAYMIAHHIGPSCLTKSEVDSILLFTSGVSQVKEQIELIKYQHQADDLLELNRHLKILVRDFGRKLQTTTVGQKTKEC